MTVVDVIKKVGALGASSRKELAQKIYNTCDEMKVGINRHNFKIREDRVKSLLGGFIRDVTNKRNGHWSNYKVTETADKIQITKVE